MRSLFARIIHMASGPVRPIRRWSVVRFLLLGVFWAGVTLVLGFWVLSYFYKGSVITTSEDMVRLIGEDLTSRQSILRPLALLGGVALGGAHYLTLRALPFENRVSSRLIEKWATVLALVLLTGFPAYQVRWWFHARDLMDVCYGGNIRSRLETLEARGSYEAAVSEMEQSCIAFQAAKSELGDWFLAYPVSGNGSGFLFVNLAYGREESFQLNAPVHLTDYLTTREDGTPEGPIAKRYVPLAEAMTSSHVPIVRLTGLWWLGRRADLEKEVDALVESGDLSFQSWKEMKIH